jgi:hypothetical protein
MVLDLSDVTICAADCVNMRLAARALRISMEGCRFGDAILFSHAPVEGPFRTVEIARLNSSGDYSAFILKQLPAFIRTPFVLVVQWDGFVVAPAAWRPEFRDYDYIGAKWGWHKDGMTVGNGGFSLRSRRLLDAADDPRFAVAPNHNEDDLICRVWRPELERVHGIRFAPESIADQFSYERTPLSHATFGFHGLFNLSHHLDGAALIEAVGDMHPYLCRSPEYAELLTRCLATRKFNVAHALYEKLCTTIGPVEARHAIINGLGDNEVAQHCIRLCEELAARETAHRAREAVANFGVRVRDAREAKQWSTMRLAAKAGIPVKLLHKIEGGVATAEPKVKKRLLALLEIADG